MIPYYVRFIFLFIIWGLSVLSKYQDSSKVIQLMLYCSVSLAIYFLIPIIKRYFVTFISLLAISFSLPLMIDTDLYEYGLLLSGFYIFESAFYLKETTFRIFLVIFKLCSILILLFHSNSYIDTLLFILIVALFSVSALLLNMYFHQNSSLQELYEQLLSEYRKVKRQAFKDEKAARMEERTRIAREMHDSVGHKLTALSMQLEIAQMNRQVENLQAMKVTVNECLEETRKAVRAFKTEEVEGISSVIHLIRKLESESHLRVQFTTRQGVLSISLSNENSVVLYRVLQEALTNVMKYGHLREANITLGISAIGHLNFTIQNAFHSNKPYHEGFGLRNMRERIIEKGGTFQAFQTGTEFVIEGTLPIEEVQK